MSFKRVESLCNEPLVSYATMDQKLINDLGFICKDFTIKQKKIALKWILNITIEYNK
jgi:hypothetical protein